jgi:hypothetical protein
VSQRGHPALEPDIVGVQPVAGTSIEQPRVVGIPEEKNSRLQKEDFDDLTDALTQFYTNRDPREFATDERDGAEILAEKFRGRWGVETSYRVIKNRVLPQSGSS